MICFLDNSTQLSQDPGSYAEWDSENIIWSIMKNINISIFMESDDPENDMITALTVSAVIISLVFAIAYFKDVANYVIGSILWQAFMPGIGSAGSGAGSRLSIQV